MNKPASNETHGRILPSSQIAALIAQGGILSTSPILDAQIQPASLDLRLSRRGFRIRGSFLAGAASSVAARCAALTYHEIDLTHGAVLETGCVYLVPLMEHLALPANIAARANPKSSTGRIDVFTRLITDYGAQFDEVAAGYEGALYLEISPRTFPILVREGSCLAQIRFKRTDIEAHSYEETLSISLVSAAGMPIGYRAKRHAGMIDVDKIDALDVARYWDVLRGLDDGALVLEPDEFYIFASREKVKIPPTHAAEMMPFSADIGEFRVHYAGFFDPGFGGGGFGGGGDGAHAVLEVRPREVPFLMEDGQAVGRLIYEGLTEPSVQLYGGMGAHYQGQGLRLSKHFKIESS